MKNLIFATLLLMLCASIAEAQVSVTLVWDPSTDAPGPADNPVKYRLYKCTDAACTQCAAPIDVGTSLESTQPNPAGISYWYVTAYNNGIVADGVPVGIQESDKSNILKLVVTVPPGNPRNAKVRTYSVP